jgi:hypothetical protein
MVRNTSSVEVQVGSLHNSGDAITITTSDLTTAGTSNYSFIRIYDTNGWWH